MQINTPSSQEHVARERTEFPGPPCCPVCSGALIPLHNVYRCARCCYYLCSSCSPLDLAAPEHEG